MKQKNASNHIIIKSLPALALIIIITFINIIAITPSATALTPEEQTLRSALLELNSVKQEMSDAGLGIVRVSDLISEGYLQLDKKEYNKTKEIISSVKSLRDNAFAAQAELNSANLLYNDTKARNLTDKITDSSTQARDNTAQAAAQTLKWQMEYANREFLKENYEDALSTLRLAKGMLLNLIASAYESTSQSILSSEQKIIAQGIASTRINLLKTMLTSALADGRLEELELIRLESLKLEKSLELYNSTKQQATGLEEIMLSPQKIMDGLKTASYELNLADYEAANQRMLSLKTSAEQAIKLTAQIKQLGESLALEKQNLASLNSGISLNLNTQQKLSPEEAGKFSQNLESAGITLEKAESELKLGNYEAAEANAEKARLELENIKAEILMSIARKENPGFKLKEFVQKNWIGIIVIILAAALALALTHKAWSLTLTKKRLVRLEKELTVRDNMVKELQTKYFKQRKMTRENYEIEYDNLHDRILELKEKIYLANTKINKHIKSDMS